MTLLLLLFIPGHSDVQILIETRPDVNKCLGAILFSLDVICAFF